MAEFTVPEIMRVSLTEICLKTKLLAGDLSITQYLGKALEPPPLDHIKQCIEVLKKMSALDTNENITCLGVHLANMPVDCKLGKFI